MIASVAFVNPSFFVSDRLSYGFSQATHNKMKRVKSIDVIIFRVNGFIAVNSRTTLYNMPSSPHRWTDR